MSEYLEPWLIERALPPYTDRCCVVARGGYVGNLFPARDRELEERAVRCVNALQGIRDETLESEWFQELMKLVREQQGE